MSRRPCACANGGGGGSPAKSRSSIRRCSRRPYRARRGKACKVIRTRRSCRHQPTSSRAGTAINPIPDTCRRTWSSRITVRYYKHARSTSERRLTRTARESRDVIEAQSFSDALELRSSIEPVECVRVNGARECDVLFADHDPTARWFVFIERL